MEHLFHQRPHSVVLLSDESLLVLDLCFQLLVCFDLLVQLFLEVDLFFVESFLVSVLETVWDICFLIQILFRFLVSKVCNALQLLSRMHLVFGS
jgi:hypothetical protein